MDNKPTAYKEGYIEFYKLNFKVTPDTLIPRPETELLVDEVIHWIMDHPEQAKRVEGFPILTILDIGTGSGNIAISIAKNLTSEQLFRCKAGKIAKNLHPISEVGVKIIATDISEKALKVAKQNAKLHRVDNKIIFLKSNLLSSKELEPLILNTCPLILVTNLPYIPTGIIPYLDSSVKDFEPHVALDGGDDGFELYRKLFQQITSLTPSRCKPKLIIGEIDYTHGELAVTEAQKYFPEAEVEVKTDLAHRQRILLIY